MQNVIVVNIGPLNGNQIQNISQTMGNNHDYN